MKFIIILLLLVSCKAQDILKPEQSQSNKTDFSKFKWQKFPIKIYLEESKRASTENAMRSAVTKWNTALGFTALQYDYESYDDAHYIRSVNNRVYFTTYFSSDVDSLGKIFNYFTGYEIFKADILIDSRYADGVDYDMESMFTHHLGHVLGEKHPEQGVDTNSAMSRGSEYLFHVDLSAGDVARIRARYGR